MTGMREQEVMTTYWSDINSAASTGPGQPHARSELATEGIQRARDPDPIEASEETESVEGEGR